MAVGFEVTMEVFLEGIILYVADSSRVIDSFACWLYVGYTLTSVTCDSPPWTHALFYII